MHALGEFLDRELAQRDWSPAQFARRARLSRQNVYQLLDESRSRLGRLPEQRTAQAIADALTISVEVVWGKALESLGVPAGVLPARDEVRIHLASEDDIPNDVLVQLLSARLFHDKDVRVDPEVEKLRAMRRRAEDLLAAMEQGTAITIGDLRRVIEGAQSIEGNNG